MRDVSFLAVVFLLVIFPACQPETAPNDAPDHRINIKLGKSLQILILIGTTTDKRTSRAPGSGTFWSGPAMGERPGAIRPSFTHTPPKPITPSTPPIRIAFWP